MLLHCHPHYATALMGLKDPRLKQIDQVTARFFANVNYDDGFGGIADEAVEGWRAYTEASFAHFEQLKEMLDEEDPSYRD